MHEFDGGFYMVCGLKNWKWKSGTWEVDVFPTGIRLTSLAFPALFVPIDQILTVRIYKRKTPIYLGADAFGLLYVNQHGAKEYARLVMHFLKFKKFIIELLENNIPISIEERPHKDEFIALSIQDQV